MNEKNPFDDAPVIFSYTRAQAIEDDVLVDLTPWAKETGFIVSVACTSTAWEGYIVPPPGTRELGQSERGRAHDVLWLLHNAIRAKRSARPGGTTPKAECRDDLSDEVMFEVIFLQQSEKSEQVTLKAVCGPGDQGEPVITIMLTDED